MTDPLLPAPSDILWSVSFVLSIALMVAALVSIARGARRLTAGQALCWSVLSILVPVLGPAAWFAIGTRTRARPASTNVSR
ncbi:PLDc N-terminal domain-containing protein [Microbacterium oryzae]|uniref:PLDc N-terminal domain-containing protein n=1 Tax=Microbacterium oryzae TaxID=743009 RepID=UPI0025B1AF47|nr:PLDc N-terminal domain-containing protein [Microbacterium oryzae]MDN3311288.1 PLDc N-terminal domain-containing protein [Microbacterium oryzae]